MKKKIWLMASFLIVLSLALTSCAPAAPAPTAPAAPAPTTLTPAAPTPTAPTPTAPTPTGPEMVKVSLTKLDGTKMEKLVEKPKYGGTINVIGRTYRSYDPAGPDTITNTPYVYTNDPLFEGDWSRGPAGTGETDWLYLVTLPPFQTGGIAESWEMPDDETIIFHIRPGVRYQNIPPLNGREVTANDAVFTIKRFWNMEPDYPQPRARGLTYPKIIEPLSVTATDKWTVVVKFQSGGQGQFMTQLSRVAVHAPEATAKAGEEWKWERIVGNGAWILKDVVPGVSATLIRNPDYWRTDFAFPENHLPYADVLKELVIGDLSTQLAAFRTGKTYWIQELSTDQAEPLLKEAPALKASYKLRNQSMLHYRVDKPELPWYNIKVRQAMQMAIDREAMKNDFLRGQGLIYAWPVPDRPDTKAIGAFMPFEELPANVQELFKYQPDKAKQLLAEAGYPNGFSMEVVTTSDMVDELSVIQFYMAKVGVKLTIDVKEKTVFTSIKNGKTHKEAIFFPILGARGGPGIFEPRSLQNSSMVDDPRLTEQITEIARWEMVDDLKAGAIERSVTPYILEQAWLITTPVGFEVNLWWPWFKGYNGENSVGGIGHGRWWQWAWIDQELKKSMGY